MNNRFFITILVVIAVLVGVFSFTKHKNQPAGTTSSSSKPTSHIEGKIDSPVVLIEYGDFQCPACGQYYPLVKQVQEAYKDKIAFQFRNFPLTQIHRNAFNSARAAEAADKQGKYWEMHDILYENQQTWSVASDPTSYFIEYAKQLGLNTDTFQKDMTSQEVTDKINADVSEVQKLGATGTPTFVLNGKKLDTLPRDVAGFNKLLDEALAAKKP